MTHTRSHVDLAHCKGVGDGDMWSSRVPRKKGTCVEEVLMESLP